MRALKKFLKNILKKEKIQEKEENKEDVNSCSGCNFGIKMCHNRPCWGTPEDFNKIMDAGFAKLIQCDFYYRKHLLKLPDIKILSMGLHWDLDSFTNIKDSDPGQLFASLFQKNKDYKEINYSKDHTGGRTANDNPKGRCVMLSKENECLLHDMGLKPEQGRQSCCKDELNKAKDNIYYSKIWDTEEGRKTVERWEKLVNFKSNEE